MNEGFCLHELVFDESGKAVDYIILDVNTAYESILGLKRNEIIGKKASEIYGSNKAPYIEIYAKVALTKEPAFFETYFPPLKKDFSISVFSSEKNKFATVFTDITERKRLEENLKKSENKFRTAFEVGPYGFYISTLNEGKLVEVNERFLEMFGYTKQEVIGKSSLDLGLWANPSDRKKLLNMLQSEGEARNLEISLVRKNGQIFPAQFSVSFLQKDKQLLVGVIRDITHTKEAEKALKESETNYRNLINGMIDSAWVIDFSGNLVDVNAAAVKTLGYSKRMLLGMSLKDIDTHLSPVQLEVLIKNMDTVATQTFQTVHTTKNGKEIPVEITSSLITYRGKRAILSIARNISERKKAELELKKYNEILEKVGDGVDAGLAVIDRDYHVVWANKRLIALGVVPNKKCYETFSNLGIVCPDCGVEKIFQNDAQLDVHEYKTVNSKGETIWIELRVTPLKDPNGATIGALELAVPITERKKAEQALMFNEQRYRELYENSPLGYQSLDAEGRFNEVNNAWLDLLGYTRVEVIGHYFEDFLVPEQVELFRERFPKFKAAGSTHTEFEMKRKDGTVATIAFDGRIAYDAKGGFKKTHCILQDVTEKKKDEAKLQKNLVETETREKEVSAFLKSTKAILRNDEFSIVAREIFDECKHLIGATAGYVALLSGDSENKVLFLDAGELKCTVDPRLPMPIRGLRETAYRTCKAVYENGFSNSDWMRFIPQGHVYLRNVMFAPMVIDGKAVGIMGLANKPSDFTERDALLCSGFGEYTALALRNSLKITEIENQKKSLQLLTEKLRVVGSLNRHDVGNKLMVAKSNLYLLRKHVGDNPDLGKYLNNIDFALNSSAEIFEFSRLYEQIGIETPSTENVFECFNQALSLKPNLTEIKIINHCQGLTVLADSLLKQIFYNFIDNSLKHGEKVTQIHLHYNEVDGYLKLFYEDNGVGVTDANKSKLFDAGFTTGKNSGLGLYLVKKMMDVYGWAIDEQGVRGEGVKFIITIPKTSKNGKETYQIATRS